MSDHLDILEGVDPESWIDAFLFDAQADGVRFIDRLIADWRSGVNRFDRRGECLLLARSGGTAVGCIGLNADPYAADEATARLRHLYVLSRYRRCGVGRALVGAALHRAAGRYAIVRLRTDDAGAARFYVSLGFEATSEDDATHVLRGSV